MHWTGTPLLGTIHITISYHAGANTGVTKYYHFRFLLKIQAGRLLGGNGGCEPSSDCEKNDPRHCVGYEACTGADLDDVKDNDTCNGYQACYNISDSSIDRNSCNYDA